jgi:2-oxoisovalerate dehydrogenase E1 component
MELILWKVYEGMKNAISYVREERGPILVHAKCGLLGHHTSGVRREWYRSENDMQKHAGVRSYSYFKKYLLEEGENESHFR